MERDLNQYHDVSFIDLKKRINLDSLRAFTTIIFDKSYGKNSNKAILDDSRKVTKLGKIFDCEEAVQALLKTKNIDEVYLNLSKIRLTSSNLAGASSIDIRPFKPFFSAHVSKKLAVYIRNLWNLSINKKQQIM